MKKQSILRGATLLLLVMLTIASAAVGQNLIPPFENRGFTLQISGYGQGVWGDQVITGDPHNRIARWQSLVTRFELKTPNPAVKFSSEIEFWRINEREANWLGQAYIQIDATERLKLRLGRMLLSGGYATPSSDYLETVHYPRVPYPVYGNGIQAEISLGKGFTLIADFTGETALHFDESKMYRKAEASARLAKSFAKGTFVVAGQVALGEDCKLYGLDIGWKPVKEVNVKGAIYAADDNVRCYKGGYLFAGYTFFEHLEVHSQVDYRTDVTRSASTIWTNGIRVWSPRKQVEVTVDHESVFSENGAADQRIFARLEVRF